MMLLTMSSSSTQQLNSPLKERGSQYHLARSLSLMLESTFMVVVQVRIVAQLTDQLTDGSSSTRYRSREKLQASFLCTGLPYGSDEDGPGLHRLYLQYQCIWMDWPNCWACESFSAGAILPAQAGSTELFFCSARAFKYDLMSGDSGPPGPRVKL